MAIDAGLTPEEAKAVVVDWRCHMQDAINSVAYLVTSMKGSDVE